MAQFAFPEKKIFLSIEDEGRHGLIPYLKRVWAKKSERPIMLQRRKYQWLYSYVFVNPITGENETFLLPTVNTAWMSEALKKYASIVDPNNEYIIFIILDGAGWHVSKELIIPPNVFLIYLPPYTPELSPAEPMVKKIKSPLANKLFDTLDDLEEALSKECTRLRNNIEEVKRLASFPWLRRVWESI